MLDAYIKGYVKGDVRRRRIVEEQERRLARIQAVIPKESPYYKFYTSGANDARELLNVPAIREGANPVNFRQALNAYMLMIGDHGARLNDFSEVVGIAESTNLITHLKNDSGREKIYDEQYRPRVDSRNLYRFGLQPRRTEPGPIEGWGRIPVLLYHRKSGNLLLRGRIGSRIDDLLPHVVNFLSNSFSDERPSKYLAFEGKFLRWVLKDYLRNTENTRFDAARDFDFEENKRMGKAWMKFEELGIIPMFLIMPIPRRYLVKQKDEIASHIEKTCKVVREVFDDKPLRMVG
jgi:hypothetical protein